jgi:chloramphenicol-sensitive protein RarD
VSGLLYGLATYAFWGVMPLYFRSVRHVSAVEVLAHRIVWSFVLMMLVVAGLGLWLRVRRCLASPRLALLLAVSSVLVAVNWLVYIHAVAIESVVHASLGYFVMPLVNVLLGMIFFRERLRVGQWLAVGLAGVGLVVQVVGLGQLPWIALAVAGSFGLYGLVRKVAGVDGMTGLAVETLFLMPPALACLLFWHGKGTGAFGQGDVRLDALLILSGPLTAVPLVCFGQAVRKLPLSVLGILQYLGPSIQLVLAINLFGEPFELAQRINFALIWTGLVIFTLESLWNRRPALAPSGRSDR